MAEKLIEAIWEERLVRTVTRQCEKAGPDTRFPIGPRQALAVVGERYAIRYDCGKTQRRWVVIDCNGFERDYHETVSEALVAWEAIEAAE